MMFQTPRNWRFPSLVVLTIALVGGCGNSDKDNVAQATERACVIADGQTTPKYLKTIECTADFNKLAAMDTELPGSSSAKVVLDTQNGDALYFQNTQLYSIHYEFVKANLGDPGLLSEFNNVTYYQSSRRFIVGAVTHYEGPKVWALEIAPYDTASAEMITKLFQAVQKASWFGPLLTFHPTSDSVEAEAKKLPASVPQKSTNDIYAGTDYQPLSLGSSIGYLDLTTAEFVSTDYVPYDHIVVLDQAPNDIGMVRGIITEQFQTPLSHVNVLSHNRKTPNMGLRKAKSNQTLTALNGKLVELTVTATDWKIREATKAEYDAYEAAHPRPTITLPAMDLSVTALTDIADVTPETGVGKLRDDIILATNRFGGKSANYAILAKTTNVPTPKAFAVPLYYYDQFMKENKFYDEINAWLQDSEFKDKPDVRRTRLNDLQARMAVAPLNQDFYNALMTKLNAEYKGIVMRFRTSTNSEDLDGFPCAGCYDSHTGDPALQDSIATAIRKTWSTVWKYRTFEIRRYFNVVHTSVGMGLLVHHSFPAEEANGVCVTNNPFDAKQLEPAFYVNVQWGGDAEVVAPPPGVTSDLILYFFYNPGYPARYLSHSNLVKDGETVLSRTQLHDLGVALDAIHTRFRSAYQKDATKWYGMDVEFKFDNDGDPNKTPALAVKQARPYPSPDDSATN